MRGHVLFLHGKYGFIRSDNSDMDADIFFHEKDVIGGGLYSGAYVEFELTQEKGRTKAINVTELQETEDGLGVVKIKLFEAYEGAFDLYAFYLDVISKINIGLRYATIIGDVILASSISLSMEQANKVIDGIKNGMDYTKIIEGHKIKTL